MGNRGNQPKAGTEITTDSPLFKNVKKCFSLCCRDRSIWGCGGLRAYLIPTCVGALTKPYVHTYTYITD